MANRLTRTVRGYSREGQKLKVGDSKEPVITHRTKHRETNGDSLAMLTQNNSYRQLLYPFALQHGRPRCSRAKLQLFAVGNDPN